MKTHTCSKCGSREATELMQKDKTKSDWLCEKCYKKWDVFIKSDWGSERWLTDFERIWSECWQEFIGITKERVIFT